MLPQHYANNFHITLAAIGLTLFVSV